jgi:hypothetical protein
MLLSPNTRICHSFASQVHGEPNSHQSMQRRWCTRAARVVRFIELRQNSRLNMTADLARTCNLVNPDRHYAGLGTLRGMKVECLDARDGQGTIFYPWGHWTKSCHTTYILHPSDSTHKTGCGKVWFTQISNHHALHATLAVCILRDAVIARPKGKRKADRTVCEQGRRLGHSCNNAVL